jgi:deoxyribodipyrimidine photo-lyase
MGSPVSLVWFRNDLRLRDQPALHAAVSSGHRLICLYIEDASAYGDWKPGAASRFWLAHALKVFGEALADVGGRLVVRTGASSKVLAEIVAETGATDVYWNEAYEPSLRLRDQKVQASLEKSGVSVHSFHGRLLYAPEAIRDLKGKPYQVYTFFWKAALKLGDPEPPLPKIKKIHGWRGALRSDPVEIPADAGSKKLAAVWTPGEEAAWKRAQLFLTRLSNYSRHRDFPCYDGTSLLSPYLHFGEISPRELWHVALAKGGRAGAESFLKELMWREFAYNILYYHPEFPSAPLRAQFSHFPWKRDARRLRAWQVGETGYPLVDAGMRQLKAVGWMHNRVRMVVASFLVKHLMQPWQEGARWFWDHLVDADLANNSMGWQWTAGCGPDAAPFFRIFNPTEQGRKFDPEGAYIRKYVPEIAALSDQYLFAPWEAPKEELRKAGVVLGRDYPEPIVDHKKAREYALKAFHALK